jgi:hypothetical protein
MDKETAKNLLELYRPQDRNDPMFAEALREVAADPALAAWFEEKQRFDAVIAGKLQEIPVPADVKGQILAGYRPVEPADAVRVRGKWVTPLSLAASFFLGVFSWHLLDLPESRPMTPLEKQAIAYTEHMPALQFVCFNPVAVAKWVNDQPGSQQVGLKLPMPDASKTMTMIGASVTDWNGHPVVMVCLQDGKRMAMLYILNEKEASEMAEGATGTTQHGDWVIRTTKADGQIRVLAAKGRPEDLDFPMPFGQGA